MNNIMVIALGTVLRQTRNKALYLVVGLISFFVATAALYRVLSLGAEVRLMRNMGLAGVSIIGMIVAVFIGANEVGRELREGTTDDLLAKPIGRSEFLIGKFFGTFAIAIFGMMLMTLSFVVIMYFYGAVLGFDLFQGVLMNVFEVAILISVAIFFATFLPETLSAVFTFLVFVIGHGLHMIPIIIDKSGEISLTVVGNAIYYVFPNLHHFNLRLAVGYDLGLPASYIITALIYGICYSVLMMFFATLIFRKREL